MSPNKKGDLGGPTGGLVETSLLNYICTAMQIPSREKRRWGSTAVNEEATGEISTRRYL